jgi:hypothetical protein
MENQSANGVDRTGFERRSRLFNRSNEERRISAAEWPHSEQRHGNDRRANEDRRSAADRRDAEWMF